jgi:hypothetical protein
MVQVTEGGYTGMLCIARKSMKLYFMRFADTAQRRHGGPLQVVEVDLQKVFADSKKGRMQPLPVYQRICGTIPASLKPVAIWPWMQKKISFISGWEKEKPLNIYRPAPKSNAFWHPQHGHRSGRINEPESFQWGIKIHCFGTLSDWLCADQSLGKGRDCFLLGNGRQITTAYLVCQRRWHRLASAVSRSRLRVGNA